MKTLTPIIILGAPRSGTTLLRVLLGQHPSIVALPETPWVGGGYTPFSVRGLEDFLLHYEKGAVSLLGTSPEAIQARLRSLLDTTLYDNPLVQDSKPDARYVLLKTPDDSAYPEFLNRFFPDAHYIHIIRDGRDVAYSTVDAFASAQVAATLEPNSLLLTYNNAIKRWVDLEDKIAPIRGLTDRLSTLRYEDLALQTNRVLGNLAADLGIEDLGEWRHYGRDDKALLPGHERGSQDVARRKSVSTESIYRWPCLIGPEAAQTLDQRWGEAFVRLGYPRCEEVCPLRLERDHPLFMGTRKDLDNPMPFSRFAFRADAVPAFLEATLTGIRKVIAAAYYRHLCTDKRGTGKGSPGS